jgi:spore germination protein KC
MKKNLVISLIIIIFTTLLSGCWSKRELNELAIAAAIGIDKSGNEYLVTVQLINPAEIAGEKSTGQNAPVLTYRTNGKTILEAIRRLTSESPRKIYVAHTRVVVLGEELARQGIADVLDFLSRDHEFRTDFYILVAKDARAEDVLSVLTPLEDIPANKLYAGLKASEESWSATHVVQLDELINNIMSKGIHPVITGILLRGNADIGKNVDNLKNAKLPTLLKIGNMAVFKKDRLVGWLTEEEGMAYSAITDNIKNTVATINFPEGGSISVEVTKFESKINSKIVNGKPRIEIEIRSEGNIGEVQSKMDLTKTENILQIENMWAQAVEKRIKKVIKTVQEDYESDIFGFGEAVHRQHPKEWKTLQKNWEQEFIDMPVDVKSMLKIKRIGTITSPIREERN